MAILERRRVISDITTIEVFSDDKTNKKKPMVLVYHGYVMNKEVMLPFCRLFAENGYVAVAIDAFQHGERNKDKKAPTLINSIVNTSKEVSLIIDGYDDSEYADNSKVGFFGISMGGMIIYNYLTQNDSKANAAVILYSTPDFLSVISNKLVVEFYKKAFGYTDDINKLEKEYCEKHQPTTRLGVLNDTPLLLISGDADKIVPIEPVEKSYKLIKDFYTKKENIELVVYPGIGHGSDEDSEEAIDTKERTIQWFKKYLV